VNFANIDAINCGLNRHNRYYNNFKVKMMEKGEQLNDDQSVIEAFQLMWGNFPEPVTLIHKSRKVLAVNTVCKNSGRMQPGMNCAKQGSHENHAGCLANQALSSRQATYKKVIYGSHEIISYWIPVEGYPEFFVHFGVGVTIDYDAVQENIISLINRA